MQLPVLGERWDLPSALPKMSVGALACHLGRQVSLAQQLLLPSPSDLSSGLPIERPTELPLLEDGADEHYARAAWVTSTSPDDPENDRSTDEQLAQEGVQALVERFAAGAAEVSALLSGGSAGERVALPWQGWALSRDAFLLTRMLELVVHADDLAVSLDVPAPGFPERVFMPVVELIARLSVRRHGQLAVVGALTRRERQRPISAF
nr:maleylpyruvate isomerase N-terminal domain-containing protein [Kineosporia rhizophila]